MSANLQLWVLILPSRWNITSSENIIFSRKLGEREIRSKFRCAKDTLAICQSLSTLTQSGACNFWSLQSSGTFLLSLLMPSCFSVFLRDSLSSCSTTRRTSSGSTVSGLTFFGVTTTFLGRFCAPSWFLYPVGCVHCVYILLCTVFGHLWGF